MEKVARTLRVRAWKGKGNTREALSTDSQSPRYAPYRCFTLPPLLVCLLTTRGEPV